MKTIVYKTLRNLAVLAILLSIGTSCTDFEDLNRDPNKSSNLDPNTQLTTIQLQTFGNTQLVQPYAFYFSSFVQLMQGDYNATNWGGQYRKNDSEMSHVWAELYGKQLKNLIDIVERTEGQEKYANIRAISRIYKVYLFSILTDTYGDVPYFDAGKGYITGNVKPAYDSQEDIYLDFFKELDEAAASLNIGGGTVSGDIIYKGDITKWQKFANSLHIRLAMRLTKVDSEIAKNEVVKVLSSTDGGVFTSNADNAVIAYTEIFDWDVTEFRRNALSQLWRGREPYPTAYISSTLWNHMKRSDDPRLFVYGRCYNESSPNNPSGRVDLTQEMLTEAGIDKFQPVLPGFYWWDNWPSGYWSNKTNAWQDKACRPQVNNAFTKGDAPGVVMSYSEIQLLLSEAKTRWGAAIATADAETLYNQGVEAAMEMLAIYNQKIAATDISNYLLANAFPANESDRLRVINEQIWMLHFNNQAEAYSNWRRSGYPVLKPAAEYGAITIDSRTIPRRLCYPLFESSYNKEGYESALAKMGGVDNWNHSVWWDKQ